MAATGRAERAPSTEHAREAQRQHSSYTSYNSLTQRARQDGTGRSAAPREYRRARTHRAPAACTARLPGTGHTNGLRALAPRAAAPAARPAAPRRRAARTPGHRSSRACGPRTHTTQRTIFQLCQLTFVESALVAARCPPASRILAEQLRVSHPQDARTLQEGMHDALSFRTTSLRARAGTTRTTTLYGDATRHGR